MEPVRLISRRQFILTLGGLAITQVLPACGRLVDKPISIAAHVWVGYEPMFLARREGWLNDKLVKLVETSSSTDSLQALFEGKVDGAALTLDEVLKARATGLPLSVVMVFDISAGADMLIVRPGLKKLADLKDRRIGFEEGAVGGLMLAEVLRTAGLTKNDVRLVSLTIDKQRDAWTRGQVDALVTYEPVASQLLAQGAVKLFDSRQIPNTIVDVLAIRSGALDYRHATAVRHLLTAHFRAFDHLHRNPHDAAYRMAAHLSLPADDVLSAFKGLLLPDVANNRRLLTGSPPPLLDTARKVSALMVQEGLLQRDDTLTALIHGDFLPTNVQ
jgi:NitT/TauT family transport system substrate-binding protein